MPRPKPTLATILASFTAKYTVLPSGCWEWQRGKSPKGYGQFHEGHHTVFAHRWAYQHFIGPIADGLVLDHLCRNHACVNPAHLEPVTIGENLARGIKANALKTVCKHGHPYTPENTIARANGKRCCRKCFYAGNLARYHARKRDEHGTAA